MIHIVATRLAFFIPTKKKGSNLAQKIRSELKWDVGMGVVGSHRTSYFGHRVLCNIIAATKVKHMM